MSSIKLTSIHLNKTLSLPILTIGYQRIYSSKPEEEEEAAADGEEGGEQG